MGKSYFRTPRKYDGTQVTSHQVIDLIPLVLSKIEKVYQQRSDLILLIWPEIIGEKLAKMTQAVSFSDGVLVVKVKNSTLHSLLNQHDKPRILSILRQRFPQVKIVDIFFQIG